MLPKLTPALLFICACFFYPAASAAQEKIYFEPKFAAGAKQSDFITCHNIVVFETTAESKFDRYSRIIPTKKFFVVCDYSAKRILVFDKTGRFVKKLKSKLDLGRLTYNEENDWLEVVSPNKMFRLTNKDNAQILEDYSNPKNFKYFRKYYIDFTDTVNFALHKQKISGIDILNPIDFTNGMHIVNKVTVDKNFAKEEDHELKIYRGDSLLKAYFPYKKKNDSRYIFDGGTVSISSKTKDTRWVTHPYDYNVYTLGKDSLYKVYDVVLPADRAVGADFFNREFQNKTEKDNYMRQNRRLVREFYVYDLSERYLNLTMQGMWYDHQQYIYDRQKKIFYDFDKINPDSATFFFPICRNLSFNDGSLAYAKMTAEEALKIVEEHKNEKISFPPQLDAYLRTATNDSNPVLINFTYRNQP